MKENQKQVSKKFTWGSLDFPKSRGVVGVPTCRNHEEPKGGTVELWRRQ